MDGLWVRLLQMPICFLGTFVQRSPTVRHHRTSANLPPSKATRHMVPVNAGEEVSRPTFSERKAWMVAAYCSGVLGVYGLCTAVHPSGDATHASSQADKILSRDFIRRRASESASAVCRNNPCARRIHRQDSCCAFKFTKADSKQEVRVSKLCRSQSSS